MDCYIGVVLDLEKTLERKFGVEQEMQVNTLFKKKKRHFQIWVTISYHNHPMFKQIIYVKDLPKYI